MELSNFLDHGIKNIYDTAGRFYLKNLKGQAFMLRLASALHKDAKIRKGYESKGTHIPPFLIASIASTCNLYCSGCYARANGACSSGEQAEDMNIADWQKVFTESDDLGVSFILLAGGEPLMRRDIIELASQYKDIIFPVFTNGTMIDEKYFQLFDKSRNLIPVVSIEGDTEQTDRRRGEGISDKIFETMKELKHHEMLYGVSITVTSENKEEVTDQMFISNLREQGCGLIFFIEYVPVDRSTEHLILSDSALLELQEKIDSLRSDNNNKGVIMLSFPGDEEAMGGCLAAGRGFFHINANGGAEPCPFSPFSELNVKEKSLLEVLKSPFFARIREISASEALHHKGGCTLFQYEEEVRETLSV